MKCRISLALLMAMLSLRPVHAEATPDDGKKLLDEVRRAYAAEDYTLLDTLFSRPAWDRTKSLTKKQMNVLAHLVPARQLVREERARLQ